MLGGVGGVLGGQEVGLAVAAAVLEVVRGRRGALVLRDHLREGRMEVGGVALLRLVVDLVAEDLEREAQAARGPVGPVLGRAGRVVELVAEDAHVAVLAGHGVTQRLEDRLVDRGAELLQARRAQHEPRCRVVGDQRRGLARGDDVADVARLGLGERAGAAVALRDRVGVRAGAAPQAAVVAVGVHAGLGEADRRLQAVALGRVVGQPAVLAPVLERVRRDVGRVVAAAAVAAALRLARLARDVEAVRVHDRDHDGPRALHEPPDRGRCRPCSR